jgi:3',5'-cyclic-nucleotide phosphodiesterase
MVLAMELRVLGCEGGSTPKRHLPGLLLDRTVLLEAGSVTSTLELDDQLEIRHVLLSHAHLDHTGGLAYLADNQCCDRAGSGHDQGLTVCSIAPVVEDLRAHFFNDRIWPDFSAIPTPGNPVVRFRVLPPGVPQPIGDRLTVIPVPVDHTVPTAGFIVDDGTGALVFSGDTGPTERLWALAREQGNVRAIVVETSFPNRLAALAEVSGHLTPALLDRELDKMPPCPVWVYHIKPMFRDETVDDLAQLDGRVRILGDGEVHVL